MSEEGGGASRSTDPAAGTSSATDVSLREYLMAQISAAESRANLRFEAMKEQVEEAFESSQRAIDKADIATEKRFEGVNEFRAALADQATRFVTQETLAALSEKLQASIDRNRDDLTTLATRIDLREGEVTGSRLTYGNLAVLLGAFATIIGLLVVAATWISGH